MLTPQIESYLRLRRALGFGLEETERLLRQYGEYATARGEAHVRAQTAIEWAAAGSTAGVRHNRLRRIVLFARYARAEDRRHELPPEGVFPRLPRQRLPIVFTMDEAARIVAEAGRLCPIGSLRPHTFSTLFALLFATGMRISEALALRFEDITSDGLVIRRTKFRKTRLIPLHESARDGLERYILLRRRADASSPHIFLSLRGQALGDKGVYRAFDQVLRAAGLDGSDGRPRPRVHDIRHTFAVRALEAAPDGRDRITRHMLALTTYLGHSHVADTYWYLQSTPRLMRGIADACAALPDEGGRS